MKVYNSQGQVSLDDSSQCLKLSDSGSVSPFIAPDENRTMYEYSVNVTIPDSTRPYLFCVKSDFDRMSLARASYNVSDTGTLNIDFFFSSEFGGPKYYRLYTSFDFLTYNTNTNYGLKLFDSDGNASYDSRVPEAILEDFLNVGTSEGIITHKAINTPWYAMNLFPIAWSSQPVVGGSVFFTRGLVQRSSTETEILYFPHLFTEAPATQTVDPFPSAVPMVTSLGLD